MQKSCVFAKSSVPAERKTVGKLPRVPASSAVRRAMITCKATEEVNVGRRAMAVGSGIALLSGVMGGVAPEAMAKDKGGVYWLSPADGATVTSPFTVKMGVKGLDVVPAGR